MTQFERINLNEAIADRDVYIPDLDRGIERAVYILRCNGTETLQSCEGGEGHAYPEPTVDFDGAFYEGFRAYAIVKTYGLPIKALSRVWQEDNKELVGPIWRMTFFTKLEPPSDEERAELIRWSRFPKDNRSSEEKADDNFFEEEYK